MYPEGYLHKFNTDNVHARAVIVGLINLLNSKIQFENVYSDTEFSTVTIPFFYNFGGDERFLQDYFLHWNDCITPQMVDGNIDPIPRGIATLTASTINTNMLTNRFIRANYVKQVGSEVLTYNAFLNSIPLTMSFDVEIYADTSLDAFKIQQAVLETFYKTQVFSVEFRGFRVPCQVGFPEDQGIQKTFEFTYQADTTIKFACPLQLETYYPVTDPTSERFGGNRMNFQGGPNLNFSADERYTLPRFSFNAPTHNEIYFSTSTLIIQWENTGPIMRVNLYYRIVGTPNWVSIERNVQNSGNYVWRLPFFNTAGNIVDDEPVQVTAISPTGRGARMRALVNSTTVVDSIVVFEGGGGYQGNDNIIITEDIPGPPGPGPGSVIGNASPSVVSGGIIGAVLPSTPQGGFSITPITQLELKIEDANNENIYQEVTYDPEFVGDTTLSTNIITNITPAVGGLGLFIGQEISGIGIPVGVKIVGINSISNQISFSPGNSTATTSGNTFTAIGSPAIITIK